MRLKRWVVGDDYELEEDYGDRGAWCKSTDVEVLESIAEALEAENAALHAECDRLTALLVLQNPMSSDGVTEE